MSYFNADEFIGVWIKIYVIIFAGNRRFVNKLQLNARIDRTDVLIELHAIQYESNVDVSTSSSI